MYEGVHHQQALAMGLWTRLGILPAGAHFLTHADIPVYMTNSIEDCRPLIFNRARWCTKGSLVRDAHSLNWLRFSLMCLFWFLPSDLLHAALFCVDDLLFWPHSIFMQVLGFVVSGHLLVRVCRPLAWLVWLGGLSLIHGWFMRPFALHMLWRPFPHLTKKK